MAKSYIYIDSGAEVDPFWGTTVPPKAKERTMNDVVDELKKSFYKNATRLDFVSTENGHFSLGKIGSDDSNTEYRIWKSYESIHNTDMVEELFKSQNEADATSKFNEITGGSFKTEIKEKGNGITVQSFKQADIGKSEIEIASVSRDSVQGHFDYMAKSDFARNSQKIDFVPMRDGKVLVLGMIGKSEIDRDSKYRIWKTYNHYKNDQVEYISEEMDRRSALLEFIKLTEKT